MDLRSTRTKRVLIEFGKYASRQRKERGEGEPETFTFLGFTHQCGVTRTGGYFALKRTTVRKRMEAVRIPGEADHDSEPMAITVPK